MKKNYEKPQIEAIELEVEDIIQTSGLYDGTLDGGLLDNETGKKENIGTGASNLNEWL